MVYQYGGALASLERCEARSSFVMDQWFTPTDWEWAKWLCFPGIEWELVRETISHATRQGTLVRGRLKCEMVLGLKEWN